MSWRRNQKNFDNNTTNDHIKLNYAENNWFSRNMIPDRTGMSYHTTTVSQDYKLIPQTSSTEMMRMKIPPNMPVTLVLLHKLTKKIRMGCQNVGKDNVYETEKNIF